MLSIEKYRKVLNDYESTDEQVMARLKYLHSFLRNVIRLELEAHDTKESAIQESAKESAGRKTSAERQPQEGS